MIIAQPEISQFTVRPDFHDFVVLGCDGIFDRMSNQHVLDVTWDTFNLAKHSTDVSHSIHSITGKMTDSILKQSAIERSFDNLTVVMISFKNLEDFFIKYKQEQQPQTFQIKEILKQS